MGTSAITSPAVAIPVGTWRSDPIHSYVGFSVRHVISTYRGQIPSFDVTVHSDGSSASLEGTAPVGEIVTADPNLTGHLMSPEFFDAERNPEVRFASRQVRVDEGRVEAEGELTLAGVTHPATLHGTLEGPEEDAFGNVRLALALETTIDRREYGMTWQMPLPRGGLTLGNEVRVVAEVELIQEN